jgi:single-stranded-DNA-specific exonuclease
MQRPRRIRRRAVDPALLARLPADWHPVLRRVYGGRHVADAGELAYALDRLVPPAALKGLDSAVELLVAAIQGNERLLIVADYDADGATSCTLAVRALQAMGAGDVRYLVPDRRRYGYGLTPEIVALAAGHGPDLLITVDNGMSSVEGVAAARAAGIKVLVTDHHLPGAALPAADAIVNPNQPGDRFPSKMLAGVGVIFYVMTALRARLREAGWFDHTGREEPNLAALLDLVALGTVADVVPLDGNNRILVAQGLARINAGRACPGIAALLEIAGRTPGALTTADLGFAVGPRLNAAGRLDDMALGIECLLSNDEGRAQELAGALDRLNHERRAIQATMQDQALQALELLHLEDGAIAPGLCLFDERWNEGVVGLVAARVKERFHRPAIAFAPGANGELKGSARSIPGIHIRDTLDAVAARNPGLISKFGGHAMAAGLSLPIGNLDPFRAAFIMEVARQLDDDTLEETLVSDGELGAGDMSLELAEQLRAGGPWGQGFPEPAFDGRFTIERKSVVGGHHLKLRLRHPGGAVVDAIAFNQAPNGELPSWNEIRAFYRLDVNSFRGTRSLQLRVEHMEPAESRPR